jgi:hypothetical protein
MFSKETEANLSQTDSLLDVLDISELEIQEANKFESDLIETPQMAKKLYRYVVNVMKPDLPHEHKTITN